MQVVETLFVVGLSLWLGGCQGEQSPKHSSSPPGTNFGNAINNLDAKLGGEFEIRGTLIFPQGLSDPNQYRLFTIRKQGDSNLIAFPIFKYAVPASLREAFMIKGLPSGNFEIAAYAHDEAQTGYGFPGTLFACYGCATPGTNSGWTDVVITDQSVTGKDLTLGLEP